MPVELTGLPVHAELDPRTPVSTVARTFDQLCQRETAHVTPKPHIAESEWLLKLM